MPGVEMGGQNPLGIRKVLELSTIYAHFIDTQLLDGARPSHCGLFLRSLRLDPLCLSPASVSTDSSPPDECCLPGEAHMLFREPARTISNPVLETHSHEELLLCSPLPCPTKAEWDLIFLESPAHF